jgi:3-isopropylmalate dehydrogenase
MFGDIATDLASILQGGMGMAGSGNIGDDHAFFEPVHGSSPKYAGMNKVNPIASINSVQMMTDWLGRRNQDEQLIEVSKLIEQSVEDHIKEGKRLTYDLGGNASCSEVGDAISANLARKLSEF